MVGVSICESPKEVPVKDALLALIPIRNCVPVSVPLSDATKLMSQVPGVRARVPIFAAVPVLRLVPPVLAEITSPI